MSLYTKILVVSVLLVGLVILKQQISEPPSQLGQYTALSQRSDVLAENCRTDNNLCSFLPFQQGWANRLWINTIQYVGQDVYANYYEELYDRLKDVTTLDMYREYPYIFGQYIIPGSSPVDTESIDQTLALGYKGLQSLCDMAQIEHIRGLSDQAFVAMYYSHDKSAPCKNYLLPQMLGFVSFYYTKDIDQAVKYYRVAALSAGAPAILFDMPAILIGKYDDDRKSMMMWEQRFISAQDQLNPELSDTDVFFILSTMQHAIRKAVHHGFLSLMEEVATDNQCNQSIKCVQEHIVPAIQTYRKQCDSEDITIATLCALLNYAQTQGRRDIKGKIRYPLDPKDMVYTWREDFQKRDIVSQ